MKSLLAGLLASFCLFVNTNGEIRNDANYWRQHSKMELAEALRLKQNQGIAKNVILFIGDGMGPNTITAARISSGGESHNLVFEKFPNMGLLQTYAVDRMVPESAATTTALVCGVKTNRNVVGLDATVLLNDCDASLREKARVKSLAALALEAGKSTGFVTTMRVTHSTPAPLYAHSASRNWECEADMPAGTDKCKDIARQLVEDWPGRDFQVVLGGGRQNLVSHSNASYRDPISRWSCYRQDGRNLINDYKKDKESRGLKYSVVQNNEELRSFNANETDYLFGIFSNAHLHYEFERNKEPAGMPSLVEMTEAAIKVLEKNPNGFFLMVEGGNIDMAHHRSRAKTAISEAVVLEDAVRLAMHMTKEEETLIVVTGDHTHTLNINGYADRGANIFGILGPSRFDGQNYTILSYASGGPGTVQYTVNEDNGLQRHSPTEEQSDDYFYEQKAGVPLEESYHGGGDVALYAKGPYSHLFHSLHEQHYVFRVIDYAANLSGSRNAK